MVIFSKKYFPYLVLVILSIPLFFMNIHDGHDIGDDFAQYIKEAINIARGEPFYKSNYIFNKYNTVYAPPQYPPGFPLLLAPIVKTWGICFRAMFYYNSFIAACLLFTCFAYFRKYASTISAICIAILITYNQYLLNLKQNILSDVPCLLFVMLYLLFRSAETFSKKRVTILMLLAAIAVLIRTQALLILVAEGIWIILSFIKLTIKDRKPAIKQLYTAPALYVIVGSSVMIGILYKIVFYSPNSTNSFYLHFIDTAFGQPFIEFAGKQSGFLLTNISDFFLFSVDTDFFKTCMSFIGSMALVFVVTGFMITVSKRLAVDDIFFLLMCLLVLYLPIYDLRYFLDALPLLFYYFYITLKHIIPAITSVDKRIIAIIITIVYLSLDFDNLKNATRNTGKDLFPQQEDMVAMQYLSMHINESDVIVFSKPRLLTLFTNKKSMNVAWEAPLELNKRIFDSLQVKYILIKDKLGGVYLHDYMNKIQHPVDSNRISDGYTLYSLR